MTVVFNPLLGRRRLQVYSQSYVGLWQKMFFASYSSFKPHAPTRRRSKARNSEQGKGM